MTCPKIGLDKNVTKRENIQEYPSQNGNLDIDCLVCFVFKLVIACLIIDRVGVNNNNIAQITS